MSIKRAFDEGQMIFDSQLSNQTHLFDIGLAFQFELVNGGIAHDYSFIAQEPRGLASRHTRSRHFGLLD
jgi:hypothetical protein